MNLRTNAPHRVGLVMARIGWGSLLVVVTPGTSRSLGLPSDRRAMTVMRLFGLRHLVQAAITGKRNRFLRGGALLDLFHGASMLLLASIDARRRRAALLDASVAIGFAAGGLQQRRKLPRASARRSRNFRPVSR